VSKGQETNFHPLFLGFGDSDSLFGFTFVPAQGSHSLLLVSPSVHIQHDSPSLDQTYPLPPLPRTATLLPHTIPFLCYIFLVIYSLPVNEMTLTLTDSNYKSLMIRYLSLQKLQWYSTHGPYLVPMLVIFPLLSTLFFVGHLSLLPFTSLPLQHNLKSLK
jgi:hypothetical protein